VVAWHRGSSLISIDEVTQCWVQFVLGWVTVFLWANHLTM